MRKDVDRIGIALYRGRKVFFLASIAQYDPSTNDIYSPFHIDEKQYLSIKGRRCSLKSAGEFSTRNDAVELFDAWLQRQSDKDWKLEIIECSSPEDIELRIYDNNHPLFKIETELPRYTHSYAMAYYYDYLDKLSYSKSTLSKIRKLFMPYGVDISLKVSDEDNLSLKTSRIFEEYRRKVEADANPSLKIISNRVSESN